MLDVEFSAVRLVFFYGNNDDSECSFVGRNFDYGNVRAGKTGVADQAAADVAGGLPYTKAAVRQNFPKDTVANKGMAIIAGREAFMCFDTDLLRWTAGWTGNYLTEDGVSFAATTAPARALPGIKIWQRRAGRLGRCPRQLCRSAQGTFGPLPEGQAKWRGCYVADDTVVLSYTVGDVQFLEQPGSVEQDGQTAFVRSLQHGALNAAVSTLVCEVENAQGGVEDGVAILVSGDMVTQVALVNAPKGAALEVQENKRIVAKLAKGTAAGVSDSHLEWLQSGSW